MVLRSAPQQDASQNFAGAWAGLATILERAINAGLAGGDWILRDPDWEPLRIHSRFQALLQLLAAKSD